MNDIQILEELKDMSKEMSKSRGVFQTATTFGQINRRIDALIDKIQMSYVEKEIKRREADQNNSLKDSNNEI